MKRLFVVDLDDTLLSKGTLPSNVVRVWRQIIMSDAPVTIATARGLRAATAPLGDAVPELPMVVLNGAVVATADGKHVSVQRIPIEIVDLIRRLADELRAIPCLLMTDGQNDSVFVPTRTDAFTEWTLNAAGYFKAHNVVRGDSPALDHLTSVVRVVLCTNSEAAQQLHQRIKDEFPGLAALNISSRDQPGQAWLDIGAANATKAHGISYVASLLKISLRDVVYYGDAISDLGPMAIVGEAVAVADAEDEVRAAAHRIIGPAGSGAVAFDLLKRWELDGSVCIAETWSEGARAENGTCWESSTTTETWKVAHEVLPEAGTPYNNNMSFQLKDKQEAKAEATTCTPRRPPSQPA